MQSNWSLDPGIIYLNHGSFGPSPVVVQESQRAWRERMERNPQRFLSRELEICLEETTDRIGQFLGCPGSDLIPVDNATYGMNLVAETVELSAGDEVLLTTHEYGAVKRIWQQRAGQCGARMVQAVMPEYFEDPEQVAEQFLNQVTDRTRLIVVSHVTSPTAIFLPVEQICAGAEQRGIPVCVDGPHAVAMCPVDLSALKCDFYVASCHKWLSAPFGTGFFYAHRRWQQKIRPAVLSWGGSMSGRARSWKDEFLWLGTRDLTGFLSIPSAIDFLHKYGLERFRHETHELARYARLRLEQILGTTGLCVDSQDWYGSMVTIPLPDCVNVPGTWTGKPHPLQTKLAEDYRIEVPIVKWGHRMHIRVSCHLYNTQQEIDQLCEVLQRELNF